MKHDAQLTETVEGCKGDIQEMQHRDVRQVRQSIIKRRNVTLRGLRGTVCLLALLGCILS